MQLAVRFQAFDRRDLLAVDATDGRDARAHWLALDEHRARAAFRFAAAVLCSGQVQLIAQDVEQRRLRIDVNAQLLSVHVQSRHIWHSANSLALLAMDDTDDTPL